MIIADRDAHGEAAAASLRESGAQALFISCNIAEKTQVEALFSQAEEAFGPVDILVNNAGINRDAMLHKLTEADWDTVIDINLKGTFLCMQQAAIRMRERRGPHYQYRFRQLAWQRRANQLFGVKSRRGGNDQNRLPRTGEKGVTVNAICPGFIDTDMTRGVPENVWQIMISKIPAGYAGEAKDVGECVAFLASDGARYINGEVINVGGGMVL